MLTALPASAQGFLKKFRDVARGVTESIEDSEVEKPINVTEDMLTKGELHNGHYCVDLGLGVKWATCNVGANSPWEIGDYFCWCAIAPIDAGTEDSKSDYDWRNTEDMVKGNPKLDAARKIWGGKWRLPTDYEVTFLMKKCTWQWAKCNGQNGVFLVSKKNGNTIFLPTTSWWSDSFNPQKHNCKTFDQGYYWSASSPYDADSVEAYALRFAENPVKVWADGELYWNGLPIRPVYE